MQVVEDELVDGRYSVAIGVDQPDELVNLAARGQSDGDGELFADLSDEGVDIRLAWFAFTAREASASFD